MLKLLILLLLLFLPLAGTHAQSSSNYKLIGSFVDSNRQLIHEHADQDYNPAKSIALSFNSMINHAPSRYYTIDGQAKSGKIRYTSSGSNLSLDQPDDKDKKSLKLEDLKAVCIGADSFIVATGIPVYSKMGLVDRALPAHRLLLHIGTTDNFAFFQHMPASGVANYLVRRLDSEEIKSLPLTHKAFMEEASKLFQDYPKLLELLQNRKIAPEEMVDIVRFIQFTDAQLHNRPIRYTASWDITLQPEKQTYYAVVGIKDQKWMLDYHNNEDQRIFSEHYAYAQPSKQDGETSWYFNGTDTVRKKRNYIKGEAGKSIWLYHRNGKPHYIILVNDLDTFIYRAVIAEDGTQLLDIHGSGKEQFYDEVTQRTITREYKDFQLVASYYTDEKNRVIYQLANKQWGIGSLNAFNKQLPEFIKYPEQSVKMGDEGVVLVRFIINPIGEIEQTDILSGHGHDLDQKATTIAKTTYPRLTFKKGKHGKDAVYQEIVVPIRFSLLRQSIDRYYYNPMWMNPIHNPVMAPINPPMRF